ncbi:Uncharacterised protein [uncultured Roseburia sp.]|uniref:YARHG domain-containing protein n=1 Tax=Brotonthovivens ammoniilytica TaxID=2981725 RepID=A0ABT2THS5_9FIRM|nr:YARHG domain-containing protein [Brotonthovivens ammoniilytica]MCU6761667.1 YARHG domain-containing protein [Brotonthovivens ammoniilytica]SCI42967.1 Uncharacterised protein [uncultured Roseburia sp.]
MKGNKEGPAVTFDDTLYPDKVESNAAGILTALVFVAAAIIVLVVIVSNFSYASHPERYIQSSRSVRTAVNENNAEDTDSYEQNVPDYNYSDDQYQSNINQMENTDNQLYNDVYISEENTEYVIPQSSEKYLTESDISGLTADQLSIARNEIYARHGRLFKDEKIQAYFDKKDWYHGTVQPEDFTLDMLNDYEIANGQLLLEYEKEMGYMKNSEED